MSAEERVSVKTTVPQYQKAAWRDHADALEMSQSEFVRTMVQAGRRGFEVEPPETPSPDANPRGNVLEEPVLEALSEGPLEFDEIVDAVAEDLERLIEETIDSLDDAGSVELTARGLIKRVSVTDGDD